MSDTLEMLHGGHKHGVWELLKHVPKEEGGDGQDVNVYVCAMPARFYKVEALPGSNSVGGPVQGFVLSTGSGSEMERLALEIAEAAAGGMIAMDPPVMRPVDSADVLVKLAEIAMNQLGISSLFPVNSDSEDFHDLSVCNVRNALLAAYAAGRESAFDSSRHGSALTEIELIQQAKDAWEKLNAAESRLRQIYADAFSAETGIHVGCRVRSHAGHGDEYLVENIVGRSSGMSYATGRKIRKNGRPGLAVQRIDSPKLIEKSE